ncbi:MAG: ATPase, T2SS/T4P/T4SS family [Bacilli bacterium]|nr:ATPase, T2SS/T4P/T4SS family [bacterium]MDY2696729.1 ATPase, T2SS/T4P/T4SS family [Bacilli bacterium]
MVEKEEKKVSKGTETNMVAFDFERTPITQVADYIIITASKNNTSDIHFDPREDGMMVRFRIDGDLQDYTYIPKAFERNLTTRLKILANMNITESRLPQDGAIKGEFGGKYLDMRVSCLPLNEGEKIVIRILDYTRSLQGIDSLGFNPTNLAKLKRMMGVPNGIILVTGATGSGKSTTVYSILQGLNKPEINIITVEDPIEMNIEGMNQVQVNAEIGMTFAAALRSILRQDPNVILIGEIRDSETAQIAVRASITGHLVLSTIHTNNSLSTIERLLDMDVERYLLSTALTGIISQRLAKQLCTKCKVERETTKYEKKVFKRYMNRDIDKIYDANPDGCEHCRKGYKGRIAIQEVLELDDEIRNALTNDKMKKEELSEMVYTNKTITMLQDALGKCIAGLTSFEEVYRVIEIESEPGEETEGYLTKTIDEEAAEEVPTTEVAPATANVTPIISAQKVQTIVGTVPAKPIVPTTKEQPVATSTAPATQTTTVVTTPAVPVTPPVTTPVNTQVKATTPTVVSSTPVQAPMPVVNLNNKTEVKPVINIPSTTVQQNVQAQTKTPPVTPAPVQTPAVAKTPGPTTPIASQTIQIPKVETKSA